MFHYKFRKLKIIIKAISKFVNFRLLSNLSKIMWLIESIDYNMFS